MRLFGSAAFADPVSFFFIPVILAQKEERRDAAFGLFSACSLDTGGLRFIPWRLAEALPLALSPPSGFCPSFRCQTGVFAIRIPPKVEKGAEAPNYISKASASRHAANRCAPTRRRRRLSRERASCPSPQTT